MQAVSILMSSSSIPSLAQKSEPPPEPEAKYQFWIVLAALTALYVLIVSFGLRRPVWYDELLTFDIANAKTIPRMWEMIRKLDFQPPLGYLFSRFSMKLIGQTPLGLRLPSMLAFYFASVVLFFYVRRKVGNAYAACALLLLWVGQAGPYATEARPYALLLLFFATLLISWDVATTSEKRSVALWGVAFSSLGMICAHVFAPLSLLPFLAAESARFSRTHKPDYRLWAALLLPVAAMILYIPLISGYGTISFPPDFQASWRKIPHFYYAIMSEISVALFLALCAALLVPQQKPTVKLQTEPTVPARREEIVLFACLLAIPIVLDLLLMRRHGAFWDRYAITTEAAIYIGMAILLGSRLRKNQLAGYAAAAVLLIFCIRVDVWRVSSVPQHQDALVLEGIRPDLPLVVGGGVTFFEMNHHERPKTLSRLYFLKNRAAALSYTNTNLFEDRGFPDHMYPGLPISGHVEAYSDFLREHREFLVLGRYDAPEEWLLRKLKDDGAGLTWLGTYPVPYVDANLYLVTLPQGN